MKTIEKMRGRLVVSCQAAETSPLNATVHIVALARAAVLGGAQGVRIEGVRNVQAVRSAISEPIIGITKINQAGSDVYITPTLEDVRSLAEAGADVIAFDATDRSRPVSVEEMLSEIRRLGKSSMADISTLEEAQHAVASGADFVGTTLSGYTAYTTSITDAPDFTLMADLAKANIPFVAEGRIWEPAQAQRAMALGAIFVVVGSAITRPDEITKRFADAIVGERR
ncbi:N-acylglucosamine-6-phosphate 2-epimerase [Pararhizobium capsulatum DSM 1112]|uniref:Putative N-acetylmannosamine-6-phosphate 2-epimerase n=1 Tax=Pararhizobium capsulatum DSM 1112 TaxID=1121113 RepID=A0ABU0BTU4_9HYPH|nr:N-acetylmannosamine-6-phosphate 2-epimerase [Pararhizobium capsulatum]MDQ0320272.1 N-acylglucosamine-6-phosphate 2-epimerase [Pararhizobium capsulatum DSM 1112]